MSHVARFHIKLLQAIDKPAIAMIEDLALDFAQPVADPGIHQDRLAVFENQWANKIEADAVFIVCRVFALPQLAWNYAEHTSAIVAPDAVAKERYRKIANTYLLRGFHLQRLIPRLYVPESHNPNPIAIVPITTAVP